MLLIISCYFSLLFLIIVYYSDLLCTPPPLEYKFMKAGTWS